MLSRICCSELALRLRDASENEVELEPPPPPAAPAKMPNPEPMKPRPAPPPAPHIVVDEPPRSFCESEDPTISDTSRSRLSSDDNASSSSSCSVRVAVFARGAKADEAKAAGADVVGAEELVEIVQGGKIDFDRCIATPDMMPLVGRLGKVLGPRGMMPNPKVGTVTMDVAGAVKASKGGAVEFRVEKAGIVHAGVGKASFDAKALEENIRAFADAVIKAKPTGAKGNYVKRVAISSTMGPGLKIDPATLSVA